MKTVCIYHSVDLDGWMSAAIIKHWFLTTTHYAKHGTDYEAGIKFIGYNYGQPIPDLSEYDQVIMCDISFPKEVMINLHNKLKGNFIWLDHHISIMKELGLSNEHSFITPYDGMQNTKFAACELTWKYFFPNEPMPEIVRLLGRYDCFGHKNTEEETKVLEFQYGARQCISNYEEAYNYLTIELNSYLPNPNNYDREENPIYKIWNNGKSIYQYLCTEAKQTYKNGFEIKFWIDTIPTDEEIRHIPAIGICDICGEEENKQLIRYYFRYENDKCNCHSPYHFDIFDCCQYCKPKAKNKVPKRFICINKERFNPINFGIDYHKDGYDGCACFWYANGMWNFSLYNDNGLVDCSVIAKQYGGGGHKGASGFQIKDINEFFKFHKVCKTL